jgi:probable rRNA maturation factor
MSERTIEAQLGEGVSLPIPLEEVERAVEWVLDAEGVEEAELSVAFVSDEEMAALNERYLSHEGTTDVISFPLHLPGGSPLGDIYIGVEQATGQAPVAGAAGVREELLRLAVHGALHILGYEHPEGPDREGSPMYLRQEELLSSFLNARGDG